MLSAPRSLPRAAAHYAFLILLAIAACSDDDEPAKPGPVDTTPPAITAITPADAFHLDILFDEVLDRSSAERADNYTVAKGSLAARMEGASAAPGDTLYIDGVALRSDERTVSLTVYDMTSIPYDLTVSGLADARGNAITSPVTNSFTGTDAVDTTPPQVAHRSPGPNAKGVSIAKPLAITFSEAVPYEAFMLTEWTSGAGPVSFEAYSNDNGVHVTAVPYDLLELSTTYTVTLAGIEDYVGNAMAPVNWSYTTSNVTDTTPPRLVATVPANLATRVDVDIDLKFTFSEEVYQYADIIAFPDPGFGDIWWSDDGKTLNFDPEFPLEADQQYTFTILTGGVQDLFGNAFVGPVSVRFTTGNALESGRIAGTVSGDPESDYANDPTGATVLATVDYLYEAAGAAAVTDGGPYDIRYLPDGTYLPVALTDSNGDGYFDPNFGDAFGVLGLDLRNGDATEEYVTIIGGNTVLNADFPLFDMSMITVAVDYDGAILGEFPLGFGLYDAVGFDPLTQPDYGAFGYWPYETWWQFMNFADGFPDGSYYVGAFLDVNENYTYDPGDEPVGFFGGDPPTAIVVERGNDIGVIEVLMHDPSPATSSPAVAWPAAKPGKRDLLKKLSELAQKNAPGKSTQVVGTPLRSRDGHVVAPARTTERRAAVAVTPRAWPKQP